MKMVAKKANSGNGYEVCFNPGWYEYAPMCPHGPMLLFENYRAGVRLDRKFYACSASRDKKFCGEIIWEDNYMPATMKHKLSEQDEELELFNKKLPSYCQIEESKMRKFCCTCQMFLNDNNIKDHKMHDILSTFSKKDLLQPSKFFLRPLQLDKFSAQYFITEASTLFLTKELERLGFTHIICIGMPRLHELIQTKEGGLESFLLDIDKRYSMFWPSNKFARFNMFNRYFFDSEGELTFIKFLQQGALDSKAVIVLDPPFGGLVDCLHETMRWMSQVSKCAISDLLPFIWLNPFFMEPRICKTGISEVHMLDYVMDYDNHTKFRNEKGGRKASPVRIFTNIDPGLFVLPKDQGYRFCDKCSKFVANTNKHCNLCNVCPSKDGRTYVHCTLCETCVKPGRVHCMTCNQCRLLHHECYRTSLFQSLCHFCGQAGHKRKDCPDRQADVAKIISTNDSTQSSLLIKNNDIEYLMAHQVFASDNEYHNAKACDVSNKSGANRNDMPSNSATGGVMTKVKSSSFHARRRVGGWTRMASHQKHHARNYRAVRIMYASNILI